MEYEELLEILKPVGIPWAYHHWEHPPGGAYGVYLEQDDDPFCADDTVYFDACNMRLEVYSPVRDRALDRKVAAALTEACIPYEMDHYYIESEALYETVFEIEV